MGILHYPFYFSEAYKTPQLNLFLFICRSYGKYAAWGGMATYSMAPSYTVRQAFDIRIHLNGRFFQEVFVN